MTTQSFILPYRRASPLYIPRRDLVLSAADSLELHITVVESDDPSAQALQVTGGIGGPLIRMRIWSTHGSGGGWWDYGRPYSDVGPLFWTGDATVSTTEIGTFDIAIPVGILAAFPACCGWSAQLLWDGETLGEMLCHGMLNLARSGVRPVSMIPILTDDSAPVLND